MAVENYDADKAHYDAIVAEGEKLYPNWRNDKSERWKFRGWLYAMGISGEEAPMGARYSHISSKYTSEYQMGYVKGSELKNQRQRDKLLNELKQQREASQKRIDEFMKMYEEREAQREKDYEARQKEEEEKRWKSGNVSFYEVQQRLGPIGPGQAYVYDASTGSWQIVSTSAMPTSVSGGYTYTGKDLVSGLQYRDMLYKEYVRSKRQVEERVLDEMRKEEASAHVRGVDYEFNDERVQARIKKYLPSYWTEEQDAELRKLGDEVGLPSDYDYGDQKAPDRNGVLDRQPSLQSSPTTSPSPTSERQSDTPSLFTAPAFYAGGEYMTPEEYTERSGLSPETTQVYVGGETLSWDEYQNRRLGSSDTTGSTPEGQRKVYVGGEYMTPEEYQERRGA